MKTKIEWTEKVWNPTIGCNKISDGCKNCYAEVMAKRLKAMGIKEYAEGFSFKMLPERLNTPLEDKKPSLYFVDSMSDLFHEEMELDFLEKIFSTMSQASWHQFQVLTKRPQRMRDYILANGVSRNVWIGTTIESSRVKDRIDCIRDLEAKIKWLSCEPLLDDLGILDLRGIDWVIVGGESGPKARPMKKEWVLNIKRQCEEQQVAFFFKQWGAYGEDGNKRTKVRNGSMIDGFEYKKYPTL